MGHLPEGGTRPDRQAGTALTSLPWQVMSRIGRLRAITGVSALAFSPGPRGLSMGAEAGAMKMFPARIGMGAVSGRMASGGGKQGEHRLLRWRQRG